jgi:hypothetical protein
MVADSSGDPNRYGRLKAYELTNLNAAGPAAVAANINAKQEISSQISLLNQQGSTVQYGDLLLIPIEDSILYVRPLYVTSKDSDYPALQKVIVSNGENVEVGASLGDALDKLFATGPRFAQLLNSTPVTSGPSAEQPPTNGGGSTTTTPPATGSQADQIRSRVEQILSLQQQSDQALQKSPPDLETSGRLQTQIRDLTQQLASLTGASAPSPGNESSSSGDNGTPNAPAQSGTTSSEAPAPTSTTTSTTPVRPAAA